LKDTERIFAYESLGIEACLKVACNRYSASRLGFIGVTILRSNGDVD